MNDERPLPIRPCTLSPPHPVFSQVAYPASSGNLTYGEMELNTLTIGHLGSTSGSSLCGTQPRNNVNIKLSSFVRSHTVSNPSSTYFNLGVSAMSCLDASGEMRG